MQSALTGVALTDIFEFARLGRKAQGKEPIMRFERLVSDLPEQADTTVSWQVQGYTDAQGRHFLDVQAHAQPALVCQRCLQPVVVAVNASNALQVVASEEQLDDDSDSPECLVGSNRFDLHALVEDELILALPYAPGHEACPQSGGAQDQEADAGRPSPFAVLRQLKKD